MNTGLRKYHAAVWDEPLVMEIGAPGRRGILFPDAEPEFDSVVGNAGDLVPEAVRRQAAADLPELSEPEVLRHYLHLSQETLGMMGISLFGTCTMKYNPRLTESMTRLPFVADTHPDQDIATLQGTLEVIHGLDRMLRDLTGMDQFVFQPGGGADAAFLHATVTRAYHQAAGTLAQRREIITTAQAHPCNPATAAAAGFDVITLPLEGEGYASVEALRSVVSERTAALMVNNPDDIGIYNPHIKEWVDIVHEAGGLCFYDHANFNGVMGRIRAAELGFDACMMMLHKTFGAPKAGGGPAVGAYGCSSRLAPFLTTPIVVKGDDGYRIEVAGKTRTTQVREYLGNIPVIVKAYAWLRALGASGVKEAADLSCSPTTTWNPPAAHPRGDQGSPAPRQAPHGDDPLQPRRADRGNRRNDRRRTESDGRLRRRRLLDEPRAVVHPGAVHARSRGDVVDRGHGLLDRCDRRHLRGGPYRSRARQNRPAQPADSPHRGVGPRRSGEVGDHLARLPPQERCLR